MVGGEPAIGFSSFCFASFSLFVVLAFAAPPGGHDSDAAMLQPLVLFCRCLRLLSVLPYFPLSLGTSTNKFIVSLLRSLPRVFRTTMRQANLNR